MVACQLFIFKGFLFNHLADPCSSFGNMSTDIFKGKRNEHRAFVSAVFEIFTMISGQNIGCEMAGIVCRRLCSERIVVVVICGRRLSEIHMPVDVFVIVDFVD